MLYAHIIVKQRTKVSELTYALSAQIIPYVRVGSLVLVPLRRKSVEGVVTGFSRSVPQAIKVNIREIIKLKKVDRVFSSPQIEVIHKLANYYTASLAEVAFHALDLPQFWQTTSKLASPRPLIISGAWSQRRDAYRQIIEKTTGHTLFIFAQNAYATNFLNHIEQRKPLTSDCHRYAIKDFGGKKRTNELINLLGQTKKAVLIGTLGDAFFPLQSGDTIIIDQPNHIGTKSQLRPFMSARQIALVRGEVEGLRVILGDSVISPEDLVVVKNKRFRLIASKLVKRPLLIINRRGQRQLIVPTILEDIKNSVKSGEKITILVMARGWASALVCQDCGQTFACQKCQRTASVSAFAASSISVHTLTDKSANMSGKKLRCRYCATAQELPKVCLNCQSINLKLIGEGVSSVKDCLVTELKGTDIQELSSDQPILDEKAQIIVATEKIFSFPEAIFNKIYIVSADRLLSGTHLDGAWRLLGYLIELQSRSQKIIVQTYFPDSSVWSTVSTGNVRPFFAAELTNRYQLNLPPYGAVISIRGSAKTTAKLFNQAEKITLEILKILPTADISYPEIDNHSGANYQGHFILYLPKPPQNAFKTKLVSLLSPSWHLDIDLSG